MIFFFNLISMEMESIISTDFFDLSKIELHNDSLHTFCSKVNRNEEQYTYLTCLDQEDAKLFIIEYLKNSENIETLRVKLNQWKDIMSKIGLRSKYYIYRYAYKNESIGSEEVIFDSRRPEGKYVFLDTFGSNFESRISLLFDNGTFKRIFFPVCSEFENIEYSKKYWGRKISKNVMVRTVPH